MEQQNKQIPNLPVRVTKNKTNWKMIGIVMAIVLLCIGGTYSYQIIQQRAYQSGIQDANKIENKMKIQKILLTVLMGIMMIGLVNAALTTLGTFKTNEEITIRQLCADCTYNNVTSLVYPNGTDAQIEMDVMTKAGSEYTYIFNFTEDIGEYTVNGIGDPGGTETIWLYTFNVNPSGEELTTAQGIIYFLALILGLIIFGITLWGAIIFPWRNPRNDEGFLLGISDFKYVKVALWVFVYLEILVILRLATNITIGFLLLQGVGSFFSILYTIALILSIPMAPLIIWFTWYWILTDKRILAEIERGIPVR
jgi:uncharacterized membrane protein YiaA